MLDFGTLLTHALCIVLRKATKAEETAAPLLQHPHRIQAIDVAAHNMGATLVIRFSHGKISAGPLDTDQTQTQLDDVTGQLQRVNSWLAAYERDKGIIIDMLLDGQDFGSAALPHSSAIGAVRQSSLATRSNSLPRLMTMARQGSSVALERHFDNTSPYISTRHASQAPSEEGLPARDCASSLTSDSVSVASSANGTELECAAAWDADVLQLALPPSHGSTSVPKQETTSRCEAFNAEARMWPVAEGRQSTSSAGLQPGSFVSFENPLSEITSFDAGEHSPEASVATKQVAFNSAVRASEGASIEDTGATRITLAAAEPSCSDLLYASLPQVRFWCFGVASNWQEL